AEKKNVSRRDFLKTSGIAAGALVGGGIIGGVIGANTRQDTAAPSGGSAGQSGGEETTEAVRGLQFFKNQQEFAVLQQATERIFPEDDLGPGAIGLGVPF
ncbi:twin-arginine translocation signal domain-containing protein, partial [Streptococcus pneumoniae]|nr:twin-arginine translocation signal domain-containing protein [Streptococcus pneumoniae]